MEFLTSQTNTDRGLTPEDLVIIARGSDYKKKRGSLPWLPSLLEIVELPQLSQPNNERDRLKQNA